MEYSAPYPSSVPHIILVPHSFQIDKIFYGSSMVLQCYFMAICAILLIFAIYFKWGNHKLLIDQSGNPEVQKKDKQNIICEVVARSMYNKQSQSEASSQCQKQQQPRNSLQSELRANTLRIYQRRLIYTVTFTIPWVVCINFFDASIVIVIAGAIFMAFVLLFNIRRMLPQWKITILLYFIPSLASVFPFIGGTHTLYSWVPIVNPLELQI